MISRSSLSWGFRKGEAIATVEAQLKHAVDVLRTEALGSDQKFAIMWNVCFGGYNQLEHFREP